jgi:hypothetical protein
MSVAARGSRWVRLSTPATAWALVAVVSLIVVAFDVVFLTPITAAVTYSQAGEVTTALFVSPYITYALVGGLIASRRPENPIGWLILAGAGCALSIDSAPGRGTRLRVTLPATVGVAA